MSFWIAMFTKLNSNIVRFGRFSEGFLVRNFEFQRAQLFGSFNLLAFVVNPFILPIFWFAANIWWNSQLSVKPWWIGAVVVIKSNLKEFKVTASVQNPVTGILICPKSGCLKPHLKLNHFIFNNFFQLYWKRSSLAVRLLDY